MQIRALTAFGVMSFALAAAQAAPITLVTATSAMGAGFGTSIGSITDGSGLSSYSPGASHAVATPANSWVSNRVITGSVLFDLHGLYDLSAMDVWNFNANNIFGVQLLSVLGSVDGTNFLPISGAPTVFAIGASGAAELAQHFAFSTTAAFVRFDIQSNYGGGADSSALSEVMFDGARANQVPAPATLLLALTALATMGGLRRRLG